MSHQFLVPTKADVAPANQAIFDNLQKALGFVPNLYAAIAYSDTALSTYLQLQNAPSSLSKKEREIINLVVSQVNDCHYCLSAHTLLGKMNGLTDEQIIEIRKGNASFSDKTAALVSFVKDATLNRGKVNTATLNTFFAAGYTQANLVDILITIADKVVMNYLHNITNVPIDFPVAPAL